MKKLGGMSRTTYNGMKTAQCPSESLTIKKMDQLFKEALKYGDGTIRIWYLNWKFPFIHSERVFRI